VFLRVRGVVPPLHWWPRMSLEFPHTSELFQRWQAMLRWAQALGAIVLPESEKVPRMSRVQGFEGVLSSSTVQPG